MNDSPLISAAALRATLDDPTLLLVDCRFDLVDHDWGRRQYEAGHIPGAVYASLETDLSGPKSPASGRHPLPSAAQFAATLARWGFSAATRVVAYDQGPGAGAARLWWLLRASGRPRVQVLDGGMAAWQAARFQSSTVPAVRAVKPVDAVEFSGVVSTAALQALLAEGGNILVDARPADRFAGQNETIDPVAGHIPGAFNMPFLANLGPDGRFLPADQQRARWVGALRGRAPQALLAMCGSGVTACHNLLALESAGLGGGRLYAGSWSEWIRDPQRPVETGPAPP